MVEYDEFIKKFPTTDDLEKAYPVGKKITWCDRYKYTIIGYIIDEQFKNKDDFEHLVIMKCWSKYKQRWCYSTVNTFVFYTTVEMMEREEKADKAMKKKKASK